MKVKLQVREAAVVGAFYPPDKDTLCQQIDEFLANVPEQEVEGNLRILIVPHAGYPYSGPVAAYGFKKLQGKDFSRVIPIGGSHQARFSEAAIDSSNFWQTPLGRVEVDTKFAQKLISASPDIVENSFIHEDEHSLEVELPFLQQVLNQFKIVPILLGDDGKELAQEVAETLSQFIDASTLILVSTDLSHYPSYDNAKVVDKKTIDAILTGKITEFERIITEQMGQGIPNLATCACGGGAVKVGMYLTEKLGKGEWRLLKYANSGDVTGDHTQVVGYTTIGYYQKSSKFPPGARLAKGGKVQSSKLEFQAQNELLRIARKTLEQYLEERIVPQFEVENEELNQHLGAFVTLRKNGQLRGCIGEFEGDKSLWQVVQEKIIDAAIHDPRFAPVTIDDLSDIKIEISVLSPKQKISGPGKIELGKHGVVIQKDFRSGVFLPQVAVDTGWDLETFLGQLCVQKAGLPWDCWKDETTKLYTFTTQVFKED